MKWNFNPPSVTSHKFYNNWLRSHRLWLSSSRGCGRQRKHVWTEIHLAFLEKVEEYMEVLILFLIWCCWLNLQVNLLISRRFLPIWPVNLTECETTLGSGFSKYVHFHCLDGFGNLDPLWTPSVGCSHSLPRCILLLPGMRHMEARKNFPHSCSGISGGTNQLTLRHTCSDPSSVAGSIPHGSLELVKHLLFCILAFNARSFLMLPAIYKQSSQTWFISVFSLIWPHFLECSFVRYSKVIINNGPLFSGGVNVPSEGSGAELIAGACKWPVFFFFPSLHIICLVPLWRLNSCVYFS